MGNNLPSEYQDNFISKFKRFFSNLFAKKTKKVITEKKQAVEPEIKNDILPKEISKVETQLEITFSSMKSETRKSALKEDIFNMVDKNPELLNSLTIEQLEEIDKMYDKKIEENKKKIRKLERALA
jgi:hypothetical protein